MRLVSVDWFKGPQRMDHLAQRNGCAAQVNSVVMNPTNLKISICFICSPLESCSCFFLDIKFTKIASNMGFDV